MSKRSAKRRWLWIGLLLILVAAAYFAEIEYLHNPGRGLPYHDSFAGGNADEWTAFGGTWELVDGMMRNESDERGAKLIAGSKYWTNYSIEADVYLLGVSGDAGLLIRTSNEEEGVNAYSGYYAGVRTIDNSLVLGRADHSWMETARTSTVPGGIRPFQWYHLKLMAFDCQIAVSMTDASGHARTAIGVNDSNCIRSGRIGLRSYSSGGVWKNIVVHPATHQELASMLNRDQDSPIQRESKAIHVTNHSLTQDSELTRSRRLFEEEQVMTGSAAASQSIASLRLTSLADSSPVTIRGVVILTFPRLYVEDSTGGVYVQGLQAPPLKVGDEVEVKGRVKPGDFSSTIENANVRALWARTPMPPLSVTVSQAATGKYDATFIEVSGRLVGKQYGPGNGLSLQLSEGTQMFRAIMNPGRSDYLFNALKLNSFLRVRGICVVDTTFTHNQTPFVLLLRSSEDVELISGPPWWNTRHVIYIAIVVILLSLGGISFYHRMENWRLRTIMDERERLAHEMHDTLAQSFAGIGFQLQAIRNGLASDKDMTRQQLDLACSLVRHSHEEARRSIATLRSDDLESDDLLAALDRCARHMVEGGNVSVESKLEGDRKNLPLRVVNTLYRIGQEAIANSVRHAQPTLVTTELAYLDHSVCLRIKDNGAGFSPGGGSLGFGIRGMRRRAHAIAANLRIDSTPGEGTQVVVEVPLPRRTSLLAKTKHLLNLRWSR